MGSASPGDILVPDSITVQLLCLGSSSPVRCQPPPQAAPRVCSMLESRSSAAPFSPQSNSVSWLKSLKALHESNVTSIRTIPCFICFGTSAGDCPLCSAKFAPCFPWEALHPCNQCCGFSTITVTPNDKRGLCLMSLLGPQTKLKK